MSEIFEDTFLVANEKFEVGQHVYAVYNDYWNPDRVFSYGIITNIDYEENICSIQIDAGYTIHSFNDYIFKSKKEAINHILNYHKKEIIRHTEAMQELCFDYLPNNQIKQEKYMSDNISVDIEFIEGHCPVRAEGTIAGFYFEFRARGDHWSIDIACGEPWWWHGEKYGDEPFCASWMEHSEVRPLIEKAAKLFYEDMKETKQEK